jgi:hypothetical protein
MAEHHDDLADLILQVKGRCLNDGTVSDNFRKADIASALVALKDGSARDKNEAKARLRIWL